MAAVLGPLVPEDKLTKLKDDAESKTSLWERIIDARLLTEAEVLGAVAARCKLPIANLDVAGESGRDALPEQLARRHGVVPLTVTDAVLEVATSNPFDIGAEQALAFATGREVRMLLASPPRIRERLDLLYGSARREGSVKDILGGMEDVAVTEMAEQEELDAEAAAAEASSRPIVKLVDVLLADGITSRASDIHVESGEQVVVVRYRIDGVLRHAMTIPRKAGTPLISRIKIMSGLDIADRLRPQDGRARVAVNGNPVDLRISTLPATHGEKVVIRILNTQSTMLSLDALGLYEDQQATIRTLLNSKEGIILCTGPTGSGKTTTLYSCIRTIEGEGVNIVTVEDPVEYRLGKNIVQVQTNEKTGLTFAAALRSILRQDPDIVLVGEIRDIETAQVAVQASLTGHLVLSTLHTNDAPNTVTRLVDMGLEAFKIGAALRGIIAQRLMRKICSSCREKLALSEIPERLRKWIPEGATLWKAVGCGQCTQTGYRGRFSVVEILTMTPEMERLVGNNANADEIGKAARAAGMRTLFECGLQHLLDGHTSVDELLRVTDVPQPAEGAGAKTKGKSKDKSKGRASAAAASAGAEPATDHETTDEPNDDELFAGLELVDEPGSSPEPAIAGTRATILLVEDEDSLRRVMKDLLEREGYVICEARDGAEAMEQVDRHNPDLVLLDLNLPNVDGYTVLERLRAHPRTEHLPVIILSARGDEDNEVKVLRLGATDFLTKPFRPRALAARLEATLARVRG
jgi:type II secretory ATPase GspE/PulE/Tfp pilus assembly ATPase PilB-like protein/ActR/RegA family two-component response regulator